MTEKVRTVYGVSSGAYSDYTVNCLFETEELAQAYIDAYGAAAKVVNDNGGYDEGDMRIEPFQLWSAVPHVSAESEQIPNREWNGHRYADTGTTSTYWSVKSEVHDHD